MAASISTPDNERRDNASAPDNGTADSEDWEVISMHEVPPSRTITPRENPVLDFQFNSRFLQLSLSVRSTQVTYNGEMERMEVLNQQERSPLFSLPAEIRLYIYELVLRVHTDSGRVCLTKTPCQRHARSVLSALLTCRRVLAEAEGIFYSINRLQIDSQEAWTSLGTRRRNAITMIDLPIRGTSSALAAIPQLRLAPNLMSLKIIRHMNVRYTDVKVWAIMAPQLVAELKKLKSLTDIEIVTPGTADLTEHEQVRKAKLDEIDDRLRGAARNRTSRATSRT